jgi:hypothetical protein
MKSFETKEAATAIKNEMIKANDWEQDTVTVTKAFKPLHGVDGWILLNAWNEVI